jgi:hypothetical protein
MSVRLCRQRQPYLPLVRSDRVPATVILDIMIDGINHNLRRRLDVDFYMYVIFIPMPHGPANKVSDYV